jgi:hypothetical protein
MVELEQVTVGGRREGINTPSSPNSRISAVVLLGTAVLKVQHCRTFQDSKGQDLNSGLSWLWLEDILVGKMST